MIKKSKDLVDENVTITTKDAETDEVKTTDNTVTVKSDKGQTAKVTLEDVNIKSSEKAAMTVTGNGSVQLELKWKKHTRQFRCRWSCWLGKECGRRKRLIVY